MLTEGVGVYGGFRGGETARIDRDWTSHEVILSGDIGEEDVQNDNSYHVVTGADRAVLDGFTITGGNADYFGGGIYCSQASPTIRNCTIEGNNAPEGGGMYNYLCSPIVTNCFFSDNNSVLGYGGGMYNHACSALITNCILTWNVSSREGGGMYNFGQVSPTLINCTFSGNVAYYGGCMSSLVFSPTVTNCIFWGNEAVWDGNEIYGSHSTFSYCDIKGCGGSGDNWDSSFGIDGGGNIDSDPLFASMGDHHLLPDSPCINKGDPEGSYNGQTDMDGDSRVMGGRVDMGADEFYQDYITIYFATDDDESLTSDMQWQLVGYDTTWRNSAETILVDAGDYTIKCKCNSGTYYIAPDDLGITVGQGQPVSYTRTYKACGYIIYICYYYNDFGIYTGSPYVGWRVVGEGSWHNGQKKYVPGNYNVEFKEVAEHDTPSNTNVTVTKGSTNPGQDKEYQRNTFYVDVDDGSDSNKGGSMNRFLTIQKGFDMVPPVSSGDPDRWIYVESNYSTIYEGITFPPYTRRCTIRSYSNLTVRGDHTPDNKPWYITAIGITFEEW